MVRLLADGGGGGGGDGEGFRSCPHIGKTFMSLFLFSRNICFAPALVLKNNRICRMPN